MNLAALSIKRPIFVTSVLILVLLMGVTSLFKLGVDLFPDVSFPVVTVQTVYPGASPKDVETLVSKPIEQELGGLPGLKTLSSNSLESFSFVIAEFRMGTDLKEAEQLIRNRVDNIRKNLPSDAEQPTFGRFDPSDSAIARLAVQSDIKGTVLYDILKDDISPMFERVDGVGRVEIFGGRKREIQIQLNSRALADRELSGLGIAQRLEAASHNIPVGKVEQGNNETILRSVGEFSDLNAISPTVVNLVDRPVRVSDVAKVVDTEEKEKTRTFLNGEKALFLDIFKQSGSNTVKVMEGVKKTLAKVNDYLAARKIPAKITVVRDGSYWIKVNVQDVQESILIGIVLCVVVVFFFLGSFRSTIITGLALPNSLLGAFLLMSVMGFTINIMTLLSLSLAVGLLIDDAIVVRENIFRHRDELGEPPAKAALEGTNEVTLAVIATSAVVISVFGPISFLEGMIGQFFKQFGLTIVFAIIISTFDALTVAPMLSAYWASNNEHGKTWAPIQMLLDAFESFQSFLDRKYAGLIQWTLSNRLKVLVMAAVIFIGSLGLMKFVKKTFLPPQDQGEFMIKAELPVGSSLDASSELAKRIEDIAHKNPNVRVMATLVGDTKGQSNVVEIYINLIASKQRKARTGEVKDQLREALAGLKKDARIRVSDYDPFGSDQRPFMLILEGQNLEELSDYAQKVVARFGQIKDLVEIDTNYRTGKPEYQLIIDRVQAGNRGVNVQQAGAELRTRVEGMKAGVFRENGSEYDIRVLMDEKDRDVRANFHNIQIPNERGHLVPLSDFAKGVETTGFSQINRQNRSRYIAVTADIGNGGALGEIMDEAKKVLNTELQPPTGITWGFKGQAEDFMDLIANMLLAFFFAIALIYLVLASLYNSFITPFAIGLALPLAAVGAILALLVTGKSLDIFSIIGLILLMGVVAKNSILLVDYTLHLMEEKKLPRREALIEACRTRLRPILMTSLALIAGMIPIAIGFNEASKQRTSMGVAIIGGLLSSTFLTLLVVPAAYEYIDNFRMWIRGQKRPETPAPSKELHAK